ncbi:hypothetical protein ACMV8I_02825 [Ewingella sp. S1.OA.A_B6]
MKIRNIYLYAVPLLLVAGIAYGNFSGGGEPDYVQNAMGSVSSKMAYSYGMSKCKATQHDVNGWNIICSPNRSTAALNFSVLPADKAPYDVPTSFYLVAENDAARKGALEGLLSYLMINIDMKAEDTKQLAAN